MSNQYNLEDFINYVLYRFYANTGLIRHDRLIRGFVIDGVHKRAWNTKHSHFEGTVFFSQMTRVQIFVFFVIFGKFMMNDLHGERLNCDSFICREQSLTALLNNLIKAPFTAKLTKLAKWLNKGDGLMVHQVWFT